ncbi:uncharacterized protein LOC131254988 [Magnolia sinica]|uniref:uncharacterized protein LOC131254988 n=1 Tax=Magnolia sinica TaxID=86752 RepID=UPI002659C1F8|nr:uncharacterized protein LOC131254988 [Magnolia sinica]
MAACKFDMNFMYVLAGWEGSASDAHVLQSALTHSRDPFVIPRGKYYVAGAGYTHSPSFMAPYRGNIIERCFGVLKAGFPILKTTLEYLMSTQVKIMLACCILHNFIKMSGEDDMVEFDRSSTSGADTVTPSLIEVSIVDEGRVLLNVTPHERNE